VREKIYEQVVQYVIKLNALYESDYPLMCADRYIISQEAVAIAKKEKTNIVAHGSTAVGNDQVRFDSALLMHKGIEILCPIKALNITREEEQAYLEKRKIPIKISSKKYSMNENVFGVTISGSEIDNLKEPIDSYVLTKSHGNKKPAYIKIIFEKGVPVSLNGKKMPGLQILQKLNTIAGSYGYGKRIYTGDCIIGIKGHLLFEAPGLMALIEAHRKLEQIILTKQQLRFNALASDFWADLVYSAQYYDPLRQDIEAYADSVQEKVSGTVTLKVSENEVLAVALESKNSMINPGVATYAQKATWSAGDANGFIKLHSMQQKLVNRS
jgi:argininosuccinate synthase